MYQLSKCTTDLTQKRFMPIGVGFVDVIRGEVLIPVCPDRQGGEIDTKALNERCHPFIDQRTIQKIIGRRQGLCEIIPTIRIQSMRQVFLIPTDQIKTGCPEIETKISFPTEKNGEGSIGGNSDVDGSDIFFEEQIMGFDPALCRTKALGGIVEAGAGMGFVTFDRVGQLERRIEVMFFKPLRDIT